MRVTCEHKVVDFEDAVDGVVLLEERDVPVGKGVLNRFEQSDWLLSTAATTRG